MSSSALLAHDETINLIRLAQQKDQEAQERLVLCNTALVKSIVKRYMGRGVEFEDLYQIGCLGLVKAIGNYDESYGVRFSTYAVPMIAGEIKRFLRDDGMIRVSRSIKDLAFKATTTQDSLRAELGREPSIKEISSELGVDSDDIVMALRSAQPCRSVDEPIYDDGSEVTVLDQISSEEQQENNAVNRLLVKELIRDLRPREKQLIILRYFRDKTQSETATILGVSQVQISRLESRIVTKLREAANRRETMLRYIDKDEFMERAVPDYEERKERKKLEQTTNLTPAERIAKARELMAGGMGEDEAASAAGYGKAGNMKKAMARLGKRKQPLASEQETKGIPGLLEPESELDVVKLEPVAEMPKKTLKPVTACFVGARARYIVDYTNKAVQIAALPANLSSDDLTAMIGELFEIARLLKQN